MKIYTFRRISAFDINENRILKTHDSISAIEFLNSHDETLLMVGTDDGGIRIYKVIKSNYYLFSFTLMILQFYLGLCH